MRWYHSYSGIVTGPAIMRRVNSKRGGSRSETASAGVRYGIQVELYCIFGWCWIVDTDHAGSCGEVS